MSNYDAYDKWARLYYEYIWDKLKIYTEKFKHLLTIQLGIVGGFVVFLSSDDISNDSLIMGLLICSLLFFFVSIALSIIALFRKDAVEVGIPISPEDYEEDDETEDYVWEEINQLSNALSEHNRVKSQLYRISLFLFGVGLAISLLFFLVNFVS